MMTFKEQEEKKFNVWKAACILLVIALVALAALAWINQEKKESYNKGVVDTSRGIINLSSQCKRIDISVGNQTALLIDVRCLQLKDDPINQIEVYDGNTI